LLTKTVADLNGLLMKGCQPTSVSGYRSVIHA